MLVFRKMLRTLNVTMRYFRFVFSPLLYSISSDESFKERGTMIINLGNLHGKVRLQPLNLCSHCYYCYNQCDKLHTKLFIECFFGTCEYGP